jgi:hypothetical protein
MFLYPHLSYTEQKYMDQKYLKQIVLCGQNYKQLYHILQRVEMQKKK